MLQLDVAARPPLAAAGSRGARAGRSTRRCWCVRSAPTGRVTDFEIEDPATGLASPGRFTVDTRWNRGQPACPTTGTTASGCLLAGSTALLRPRSRPRALPRPAAAARLAGRRQRRPAGPGTGRGRRGERDVRPADQRGSPPPLALTQVILAGAHEPATTTCTTPPSPGTSSRQSRACARARPSSSRTRPCPRPGPSSSAPRRTGPRRTRGPTTATAWRPARWPGSPPPGRDEDTSVPAQPEIAAQRGRARRRRVARGRSSAGCSARRRPTRCSRSRPSSTRPCSPATARPGSITTATAARRSGSATGPSAWPRSPGTVVHRGLPGRRRRGRQRPRGHDHQRRRRGRRRHRSSCPAPTPSPPPAARTPRPSRRCATGRRRSSARSRCASCGRRLRRGRAVAALGPAGGHHVPLDGQLADRAHQRQSRRERAADHRAAGVADRAARPAAAGRLRELRPAARATSRSTCRSRCCGQAASFASDVADRRARRAAARLRSPAATAGFFDHSRWGFGQPLESSALLAAIQSCPGVAGVYQVQYRQRGVQGLGAAARHADRRRRPDPARRQRPEPARGRIAAGDGGGIEMSDGTAPPASPGGPPQDPQVGQQPAGPAADLLPGRRLHRLPPGPAAPASRRAGHRPLAARPGDLGLQILEWWAYLGDVLTFYNERIANESYLRTATRQDSVANLVALLGYQPAPGLAATGNLAVLRSPAQPGRAAGHPGRPAGIQLGHARASRRRPSRSTRPPASPARQACRSRCLPAPRWRSTPAARRSRSCWPAGSAASDRRPAACWPRAASPGRTTTGRWSRWGASRPRLTLEPVRSTPWSRSPPAPAAARPQRRCPARPPRSGCCAPPRRPRCGIAAHRASGEAIVAQSGRTLTVHLSAAVRGISPGDLVLFDCGAGSPSALASVTATYEALWSVPYPAGPGVSVPALPDIVVAHTALVGSDRGLRAPCSRPTRPTRPRSPSGTASGTWARSSGSRRRRWRASRRPSRSRPPSRRHRERRRSSRTRPGPASWSRRRQRRTGPARAHRGRHSRRLRSPRRCRCRSGCCWTSCRCPAGRQWAARCWAAGTPRWPASPSRCRSHRSPTWPAAAAR